jgi:hypothetical protein
MLLFLRVSRSTIRTMNQRLVLILLRALQDVQSKFGVEIMKD